MTPSVAKQARIRPASAGLRRNSTHDRRARTERLVLCLVIAAIPFMRIIGLGSIDINLSIADALLPLMAFVALRPHAFWSRMDSTILYAYAFLVLTSLVLSLWWANLTSPAVLSSAMLAMFKLVVALVYLLLLSRLMAASVERGDYVFVKVWAAVSVVIAAAALAASLLGVQGLTRQNAFRNSGSFDDPNLFAIYLIVSAGVSLWLHDRTGRWLPMLAVVANLAAIPTTGSRGGAVALVAALLVAVAWMSWKNKLRLLAVVLVAALAALAFANTLLLGLVQNPSVQRIVSNEGGLDSARRDLWAYGLDLWGNNLFLGVGPGQFQILSSGLIDASRGNVVHNTYLSVGVELGIIGFVCFFSLWAIVAWRAARMRRGKGAGLLLAVAGLALGMVTLNLENARFAWALAAFVLAVTGNRPNDTVGGENASTISHP